MSNIKDRKVKQVAVSPELAARWLKKNTSNRPIRPSVVEAYALAMKRGEWVLTPEPIMFSKPYTDPVTMDQHGETLMEGQHRLMAVIKSGVTVEFMVWWNCEPEEFHVIGQSCPRTASDILGFVRKDLKHPQTTASVCAAFVRYGLGENTKNHAWVAETVLEHIQAEVVAIAEAKVRLAKFAPRPMLAALVLGQIVNPSQNGVLIKQLKDNIGFTERDPARAIHVYMASQLAQRRDTDEQMFYKVCNGVAAKLDGRALQVLRVNAEGLKWLRDGGKDRLFPLCRALYGKINVHFLSPRLLRIEEEREPVQNTVVQPAS